MDFMGAIKDIERDKGISKETLLEAIEAALVSAYRRHFGSAQNVNVQIDRDSGDIEVLSKRTVVEEVQDSSLEISLQQARKIDPDVRPADEIEVEVTPESFGRIAAQTAKQVVTQRIREAERDLIYEDYITRQGDLVTGIVRRMEGRNVYVDLGRAEAMLIPREQIPNEYYEQGERIKAYILEVKQTTKGPQILLSRSHPQLIKRLFELEVPEVHEGLVEIMDISREAGARSKVAVQSRDPDVDAVGACVGQRGRRVRTVVQELKGEKVDIVQWSEEDERYVANALSPADVIDVHCFLNEDDERIARVVVPDDQLSLAIGKEGQNARLAAKLTRWKIDIQSETEARELEEQRLAEEGHLTASQVLGDEPLDEEDDLETLLARQVLGEPADQDGGDEAGEVAE